MYLGFDFGTTKVGIAVGQAITKSANPLTILPIKNGMPAWQDILSIVQKWKPAALIVGLPLTAQGEPYKLTHAAKRFGEALVLHTKLPVHFIPEHLTTRAAKDATATHKHLLVDAKAASLILETWLSLPEGANLAEYTLPSVGSAVSV